MRWFRQTKEKVSLHSVGRSLFFKFQKLKGRQEIKSLAAALPMIPWRALLPGIRARKIDPMDKVWILRVSIY